MPFKVSFIINHAAFFVSHRLPIALAVRDAGNEVELITGQAGSPIMEAPAERALAAAGVKHHRVAFKPSGMNPLTELRGLIGTFAALRNGRPDVVHCASPKGLLYGGAAARLSHVPALVLAVSGLGFAFTDGGRRSLLRRLAASIFRRLARFAFRHPNLCVIVQNVTDLEFVVASGLATHDQVRLIPGSGVDLSGYPTVPEAKQSIILVPARMVRDKGIYEIAEAARSLCGSGWRVVLAGAADYSNPSNIPAVQLEAWQREGIVEWVGHVEDMRSFYAAASIVCLPSYREGMPKALLEAAAAGCAVVTTNAVGCREAIIPGKTGDLVPVADAAALADALLRLIADPSRRECYGRAGRVLALERFGIEAVVSQTREIYEMLLERAGKMDRDNA